MTIYARIYQDENGDYCAEVPALPGCFSCGDTFDDAVANIREAAEGWLAAQEESSPCSYPNFKRVAL